MSREFLVKVLDKLAQVTTIIVETSKIKEDLEKCGENEAVDSLIERTKQQTETLLEHAKSVQDLFTENEKNNNKNGESAATDEESSLTAEPRKPLIKVIDIKKLVEPKEETQSPPKRIHFSETVVIITSSDEDKPKKRTTTLRKPPKRRAAHETIRKTRKLLQNDSSESSDSDTSAESINISSVLKKNWKTKVHNNLESTVLNTSSDSSDDEALSVKKDSKSKKKSKKEEEDSDETETEKDSKTRKKSEEEDSDETEIDWENDAKFKSKCYVKVYRIPCEKLKEYYLEKLELQEINKLCDTSGLDKKRKRSSSESSSSSASENTENKKTPNKKKKKNKTSDEERKSESDSDSETDNDKCEKDTEVVEDSLIQSEISAHKLADKEKLEEMADDLAKLLSDKEEDESKKSQDSSDEEETNSAEKNNKETKSSDEKDEKNNKETKSSDDEDEKNKETKSSDGEDEKNNKETKSSDEEDEKNKKDTKSSDEKDGSNDEENVEKGKENEEKEKDEKTESKVDEEKKEKKNNKAKKDWKKDRLLASSSDSEDECETFCKNKGRMQKEVSSDDELKLPTTKKKKRMLKKRMRKAILSDSDSGKENNDGHNDKSSSSSSESDKEEEKKDEKPKRKRVKRVKDSSEDESEEKSTRKQIRNIWGRDSLAETTKRAEAEEKERKARIAEKQKKYNQIYESGNQENATVEKVVLDYDDKNQKALLKVDKRLVEKLKPHQASGLQFMWDACFESLERAKNTTGSGCILAHCMGLGKTLQVVALSHTLLENHEKTNVRKIMVVCPLNTVLNWVNEFKMWIPDDADFDVYELVTSKQNHERQYQVNLWHQHGGVLIVGYEMFRNLTNPENKRLSKKLRNVFREAMVDPGPDLVVCDEGHLLKNEKTNLSIAMNRIKTLRRIVLTGTPLQNNLKEYFCMVQFIKPNLLGTYKEYLNRFVNPITNGQYTDSTPHDIQVMRRRSHVLHKMLDGVVQRRDYSVLEPYLPPKFEYVLFLKLTEVQIKLYQYYMDHFARRPTDGPSRTSFLFVDFQSVQRICTHPRVLLDKSNEMKAKEKDNSEEEDSEGSLKDFIDDEEESTSSSGSSSDNDGSDTNKKGGKAPQRKRVTRAAAAAGVLKSQQLLSNALLQQWVAMLAFGLLLKNEILAAIWGANDSVNTQYTGNNLINFYLNKNLAKENGDDDVMLVDEEEQPQAKEWWQEFCDGQELDLIAHSSKLFMLFEILKECEQIGDKILVFSQSLYSLNVIEYFLNKVHEATQAGDTESVGGYSGSWCLGLDYFRLDGSSSCENRTAWCKIFNNPTNTQARLFLISTKAGGLGINLIAANRVIIFDVSWNPSHDIQSIYRVYRFGQTKPCYIYRFVTYGTMEMKVYERQVTKQAISKRVIDEQQIDRHYNQNDLAELYKFEPDPGERPIPLVPKDVLLGELIQKFEDRIYKYHEHQSLLENKEEEGLNEEERKAAWEEFENEKKQRTTWGNSIIRTNHIDLALISMLRKENTSLTEVQIREMLPIMRQQLNETVAKGDLTLYTKVQQEIQLIQMLQNQRFQEQLKQHQMFMLMQQQQQQLSQQLSTAMGYRPGSGWNPDGQAPSTSRSRADGSKQLEVVDLID